MNFNAFRAFPKDFCVKMQVYSQSKDPQTAEYFLLKSRNLCKEVITYLKYFKMYQGTSRRTLSIWCQRGRRDFQTNLINMYDVRGEVLVLKLIWKDEFHRHTEKRPRGPRTTHTTHCCKEAEFIFRTESFLWVVFRFTEKRPTALTKNDHWIKKKPLHIMLHLE